MQISELTAASGIASSDVLAVEADGVTYKVSGTALAASLKTIGALLAASDVVNNLSGTATDKPLSAAQGKALKDTIDVLRIGATNTPWVANADYNDYTTTGIYFISTNPTNGPSDGYAGAWSILVVFGGRYDSIVQLQFNTTGSNYRIYSTTWRAWKSLTDGIATSVQVGNITTSGTYQLPADILSKSIISLTFRRDGYCATWCGSRYALVNGASSGAIAFADNGTRYMTFTCSSSGLITVTHDGLSSPVLEVVGV